MKEFDIIKASRNIKAGIPKGTKGTILIVYNSSNFEVEFFSSDGESLGIHTVSIDDIQIRKK